VAPDHASYFKNGYEARKRKKKKNRKRREKPRREGNEEMDWTR
jgi:hypothetical protein